MYEPPIIAAEDEQPLRAECACAWRRRSTSSA